MKIALKDLYETKFGIYNHIGSTDPFASVAYHEAENFMHLGRFKDLVKKYYFSGVAEITKMTLAEFLNETPSTIEDLIETCMEITKEKNAALAAAQNDAGDGKGK